MITTKIYIRKYGFRAWYKKQDYYYQDHERRYIRRAEQGKLVCQDCHGEGRFLEDRIDGYSLYTPCDWCCGCGYVVPWVRGFWLREQKRALNEKSTNEKSTKTTLTNEGEARTARQEVF